MSTPPSQPPQQPAQQPAHPNPHPQQPPQPQAHPHRPLPRAPPQQLFTGRHFLYAMVASVGAGMLTMTFYKARQQKLAEAKRAYDERGR
ncbi:hypothetical protein AJ79_03010 [Helicocarpus griseus UAMH5409]|uniref:Uncharacterized protein n=1 Tax=Helicocarpus griseus UAMH5409 TaxID=1447875 RepID=A0A2B7Y1D2_9EURO|nr:hypothetical protein AJ79_03010 [Helicocarpus griseus UAMH5409]